MIEKIKNEIYHQIEILFAETITYELANDMSNYQKSLKKIACIANELGIKSDIVKIQINLRKQGGEKE